MKAVGDGKKKMLQMLLQRGNVPINSTDAAGRTPLYVAVYEGLLDIVELLLQHGADVNKAKKDGSDPLFCAVKKGYENIVLSLLARLPKIDKRIVLIAKNHRIGELIKQAELFQTCLFTLLEEGRVKAIQHACQQAKPFYAVITQADYHTLTVDSSWLLLKDFLAHYANKSEFLPMNAVEYLRSTNLKAN